MNTSAQRAKLNCINLSGSASLVYEYLDFAINTILFQRGIRPQHEFETTTHYGLSLFKLKDGPSVKWIKDMLSDVQKFIIEKRLNTFRLVIMNDDTKENFECWEFKVDDSSKKVVVKEEYVVPVPQPMKSLKLIQLEISHVMRQIMASVSVLPLLDCPLNFKMAMFCAPGTVFPPRWKAISDHDEYNVPVTNSQQVDMRRFGTGYHSVSTCVRSVNTFKFKEENEEN